MESVGDPENSNPYVLELNDEEANGTFSPLESLRPRGWSYNVIKINNSENKTYSFDFNGDTIGSEGASSHFEARIVGTASVDVLADEAEVYLNIVAVPEYFSGNQTYDYVVEITRD